LSAYRFPPTLRQVMGDALPETTAVYGEVPDLRYTYVPATHMRALHPDTQLVVGMRGAGKSFWWGALQSEDHRRLVSDLLPRAQITGHTRIGLGYGTRPQPDHYPGKETIGSLLRSYDARDLWRTVVIWQVVGNDLHPGLSTWAEKIDWVRAHPEPVERALFDADLGLEKDNTHHLILFDALDRTADDWTTMGKLLRGLFQVLLEFRSYARIRPKVFVRPDNLGDAAVADFPDASKVLTQKVELRWPRLELYNLLWQHLANEPRNGALFRDGCGEGYAIRWQEKGGVWTVPDPLRHDEELQRRLFHAITGPWMGKDHRRGFPYTWLPNHLGDAQRQVSPRSFLAALHRAAEDPPHTSHPYALYYESIKRGVQEASRIRVQEMQEDYPWVDTLMAPLSGLSVPCRFDGIEERWRQHRVLDKLRQGSESAAVKLPPAHLEDGAEGVRRDLEVLGVFQRMSDGRVNLPDVYRVGYGMRRRGGVKAIGRR